MHRPRSQVAEELAACIRCNQCLAACPALAAPITIETLNRETLDGPISAPVMRFAQNCYLCGACVPVCPVGLHRNTMMTWLKMRLLRGHSQQEPAEHADEESEYEEEDDYQADYPRSTRRAFTPQAWTARGWRDD
jgi:Na+-translocating ferredoxin:NAD+ oxidoreductase RnfC subunit